MDTKAAPLDITLKPCESSQITGFGYHPDTRTLRVQFKKGGTYDYKDVDPEKHEEMCKAESVGSFLHTQVKGKHEFERLPDPAKDEDAAS